MEESVRSSVQFSEGETLQSSRSSHKSVAPKVKLPRAKIDIFNDPLYNKDGKRNQNIPYDLFVVRRKQALREEEKKRAAQVSKIASKDAEMFEKALEKLKQLKAREEMPRLRYLHRYRKSKAMPKSTEVEKPQTRAGGDGPKYSCPLVYPNSRRRAANRRMSFENFDTESLVEEEFLEEFKARKRQSRSRSKVKPKSSKQRFQKSKSKERKKSKSKQLKKSKSSKTILSAKSSKSLKKKPSSKTVIDLPPLKRKPWRPPMKDAPTIVKIVRKDGTVDIIRHMPEKRQRHPVIEIPPFKTRKWVPPPPVVIKKVEKKKINYPKLKLRKIPWKPEPIVPQQKKKPKYEVKKLFNPIPRSTLGKVWHHFKCISHSFQILSGSTSQNSKKFGFMSNGKQSAFISLIALSTQVFLPTKMWKPKILDDIVTYGDVNFRRQMRLFKRQSLVKPTEISRKLYLKSAEVRVNIESVLRGIFDMQNASELVDRLNELFETRVGGIFLYNNQFYAIWKEDNGFFVFNSRDTDSNGKLVARNQGGCCVVRSTNLETIVSYLASDWRIEGHSYELFSFCVENVVTIEEKLQNICPKPAVKVDEKETQSVETVIEVQNFETPATVEDTLRSLENKSDISAILANHQCEPKFAENFQKFNDSDHFCLTSDICLSEAEKSKAPFVCATAVAMLKVCKSSLWSSSTMSKIFKIGQQVFAENAEKVAKNFPITEIQPVVTIGSMKLQLKIENLIIGKCLTKNPSELSLQSAVDNFFKLYDYGLILGHDAIAIWREQNFFFLFDPNQCEQHRRAQNGINSCLSYFASTKNLVELLIENLPKDQRSGIFKICKLEIEDFVEKSSDWKNFKAIGEDKWILSGHISEESEAFDAENRGMQSACISLAALGKTREVGVISWSSNVVDEIVRIGDKFYSDCVAKLKENGDFDGAPLKLSKALRELKLEKVAVEFFVEDGSISGKLFQSSNSSNSLLNGLQLFFASDDLAVLSAHNQSLAVFRYQDAFFVFDSQARSETGRNFDAVDPTVACRMSGAACVLRFAKIQDLATHILSNVDVGESSTYEIRKIEISVATSSTPCYYNYEPLGGAEPYAAILRAFNESHEDSEQFKLDAVAKTLCNLVSCMCFTRVINPRSWKSSDINEILKIGYRFLCRVSAVGFDEIWSVLQNVDVCSLKMKIEVIEEIRGVFVERETEKNSNEVVNDTEISAKNEETTFEQIEAEKVDDIPLNEVLRKLEEKDECHAVLMASIFNVAIFKMRKFYFVFDPKASSEDGKLVKKRLEDFVNKNLSKQLSELLERLANEAEEEARKLSKEEEFQEFLFSRQVIFNSSNSQKNQQIDENIEEENPQVVVSEKGSAYVAWFTSIDLLCNHLISKIPEKLTSESFTMKFLEIHKQPSNESYDSEKWHNFNAIDTNRWIIRGTFSQNDSSRFAHKSQQDSANCVMSLIFSKLCRDHEWTSEAVDLILSLGNRLHKKSSKNHSGNLKVSEIQSPIFIRPFVIKITHELVRHDFIVKKDDKVPLESLKIVLKNILNEGDGVVLVSKGYHVAVWKSREDDSLVMFDPHDIGPDGRKKSLGVACLQRFVDHSSLVDIFWSNVKDIEGINEYQLFSVRISAENCTNELYECPELPLSIEPSTKSIRGKKVHKNTSETVCHAIASLCVSSSLHAEYFTPEIIDGIVALGNELSYECATSDEVCFKDFDLNKRTACPDEICWNFRLNEAFASVQMDIFQRGTISRHTCPLPNLLFSLEEFFNFHKAGVLVTRDFAVAIWRENCEFFVFYACDINEDGRLCRCGHPGVVIFRSIHELYSNIMANIQTKNGTFELRICDVKLTDLMDGADECSEKKAMKKFLNEEIVVPAVSHRKELFVAKVKKNEKVESKEISEMIEKIKRREATAVGFMAFSRGGFLCGKISKNSKTLGRASRRFHSGAICVVAAAMNEVKSMGCWSGDTIDSVIISGNKLHIESSIICGTAEVEITKLVTPMEIADREVESKVESCFEIAPDDFDAEQAMTIFKELLSCYNACYTRQSWDCWTVLSSNGFFYLFDPLGIEIPLKKVKKHRATLYRFDCLKKLVSQLLEIIDKSASSTIEIGGILVDLKPQELKDPLPKVTKPKKKTKKPIFPAKSERERPIMMLRERPEKCRSELCCVIHDCCE